MKVAIVHYWLIEMRGGEKVVEALCELFPDADLYTHVYDPAAISPTIARHRVRTSFIDKLPGAKRLLALYLPLMPLALEQFDLREYDLVISSESGPGKGVITGAATPHLCYCHSPPRYLWNMYQNYREDRGWLTRFPFVVAAHYLRLWDLASAARVDRFVANSSEVARRIRKYYRRSADVVHPPVDVSAFRPGSETQDYYLFVGQLTPYKRADLAVEAFNRNGKRLIVIGRGEQYRELKRLAAPNVTIESPRPFDELRERYARCRALVFPGEEDFGIVPVEAMASGRPVIAYRGGGALDTVVDGTTGVFFDAQTPEALNAAVRRFENTEESFDPAVIARHAAKFDVPIFKKRMMEIVDDLMSRQGGSDE